ncbi:MAG: recombinase RecA [Pirellulaceae bacterium]|nr:MAG: recombinase RecA [Pirellulaceae bacterium]
MSDRVSTGIQRLDQALGGGLLPGSLVMICGATGIGKTQLGVQMLGADSDRIGAVIDLSSRGDSQNHHDYAQRLLGRPLDAHDPREMITDPFAAPPASVLPFLGYHGRRVLRSQMDVDQWHAWQSELNRRLPLLYRFIYSHLVHGCQRFLIDGIEPLQEQSDSLQLELTELIYHRMLRKEHDWLAREVLREQFAAQADRVAQHAYDHRRAVAIVLVTTPQSLLDQLMSQPLADGDLAAGANTVMLMGRRIEDGSMRRGLFIAKHRGSFADPHILSFDITAEGVTFCQ